MDPTERAARLVKLLKEEEWKALVSVEKASLSEGPSNIERITRISRMPKERVWFALESLSSRRLIYKENSSFVINQQGIEILAIKEHVKRNLLEALGPVIAKGKESDVYRGYGPSGSLLAVKFFKLGRISFRSVRKKRFVERREVRNWVSVNYDAAKREYISLKKLEGNIFFPKAYSYNRNTVLLSYINGTRLSNKPELENPENILEKILDALRFAYSRGVINADISEYNILTDGINVWLIDWPQAVGIEHPNAPALLERDVTNILRFFDRVYSVKKEKKEVIRKIIG